MRRNVDSGAQWKLRAGSPAVSRRRRRVRRIPPCFLFSTFCFSIFFFYKETDTRPDSLLWSLPFFVFSKISFLETETKDQEGYDFPSHLNFLPFFVLFSRIFFIFWGRRATWNAFPPSWVALFFPSYITYFSTWRSHYEAIYYSQ